MSDPDVWDIVFMLPIEPAAMIAFKFFIAGTPNYSDSISTGRTCVPRGGYIAKRAIQLID